jgi:hypothetical protein
MAVGKIVLALALLAPLHAAAQGAPAPGWVEEKCVRYKRAWSDLAARRGTGGLGRDFIERHDAFLASGCTARGDVCPRSEAELAVANALVIAAMNAGTAGSFLPFACRR